MTRGRSPRVGCGSSRAGSRTPTRSVGGGRSRSSSVATSAATSELGQDVASARIAKATRAILQRHDGYTKELLCQFLAQRFPEIPSCARKILVVGASTAAAFAAHHYDVVRESWMSDDPRKKKCGSDAGCVLSYWSMGLSTSHLAQKHLNLQPTRATENLAQATTTTARDITPAPRPTSAPVTKVLKVMLDKVLPVPIPACRPRPMLRDDLVARALASSGLSEIISCYGESDLADAPETAAAGSYTNADDVSRESRMAIGMNESLTREGGLLSIGAAVLAQRNTTALVQTEQYEPAGASMDADETVPVINYVPTPIAAATHPPTTAPAVVAAPTTTPAIMSAATTAPEVVAALTTTPVIMPVPTAISETVSAPPAVVREVNAAAGHVSVTIVANCSSTADDEVLFIDSDATPEAGGQLSTAALEVDTASDAMSVISSAALSARESAEAPLARSGVRLVSLSGLSSSTRIDRREESSSSTALKRKPSCADPGTPSAKRQAGSSSSSTAANDSSSTTQRPSTSARHDDGKSSSRVSAAADPKERERQSDATRRKTVSPAKVDVRGPSKDSTSSSARSSDKPGTTANKTSTGDDRRPEHRESADRADERTKTSNRPSSTSDRYDPDTGHRVPEKASSSTSDPPLIIEQSTSDFDEDTSLLERSRQLKSVVKSVKESQKSEKGKDKDKNGDRSKNKDENRGKDKGKDRDEDRSKDRNEDRSKDKGNGKGTRRRSPSPDVRISLSREDNAAVQQFLEDRRRHAKR